MGYVSDNLQTSEEIIIEGKLHWIIFVSPLVLLLVGWLLNRAGGFLNIVGIVVMLFGLYRGIKNAMYYFSMEFAATNKRLIGKRGLIARDSLDLRLGKVESIYLKQDLLGRLFGYGAIEVRSAGDSNSFPLLTNALTFRSQVSQLLTDIEERGYVPQIPQVANQASDNPGGAASD